MEIGILSREEAATSKIIARDDGRGERRRPGAIQIAPTAVATGDVSEATEGLLVEVEGIITRGPTNDLPFGYSVFIDEGSGETQIFIPATTGVNPFNVAPLRMISWGSFPLSRVGVSAGGRGG